MKLESRADDLMRRMDLAFELAVADARDDARAEASKHDRTGKFSASIVSSPPVDTGDGYEASIGSPLSSAKAKEKGAYITAKRGKYLVFDAGQGVRKVQAVRLRPQPAVTPAGRRFSAPDGAMARRLREQLGGAL